MVVWWSLFRIRSFKITSYAIFYYYEDSNIGINDKCQISLLRWGALGLRHMKLFIFCKESDGESFQHKDTRVPSEPRYELRKRTHSQQQQNSMLLLIHKFEKLSIHEMNEENLSKKIKESVDPRGLSSLLLQLYYDLKIDLVIWN